MPRVRRFGWWAAVPAGIALGLLLALAIDRAAPPAAGAASGFTVSVEQLKINQRIAQQGVRRANRANARLDALAPGTGGGAGPSGAAGPAGPGAARIAFEGPVGTPPRQVMDLAGIVLRASCEAGPAGETLLVLTGDLSQPITLTGTASGDGGTDPANPASTNLNNFQDARPAGTSTLGTVPAGDGTYFRVVVNVLLVSPTRTVSVDLVEMADGINDRCSFNGVAVPSG
jgi:hypothetical protein